MMNKKLECIKNLKSKLIQMQNQLQLKSNTIQSTKQLINKEEKLWFNKTATLANYNSVPNQANLPRSPSWRNPTYWGTNPIVGKQNTDSKPSKWVKHKSPRKQTKQLSPQLSKIKNFVDENFYDHTQPQQSKRPRYSQKYFAKPQRFQYSYFGSQQRDTPRFQKIKTYDQPTKNPILDPEKSQQKGKKMIRKPSLSPSTNLIQNPKSNPSMYFYKDKIITLSPKSNNRRNLSPSVKQILSSSLEEAVASPKKRSCKKHFARYFKQTFQSKWS